MTHEEYRNEWINAAINYLMKLGVYAPDELEGANELAETLWEGSDDDQYCDSAHAIRVCAEEAVDEELTYWGD